MSLLRLIARSLLYDWLPHTATALGAAVATAVLTAALIVGDSMRASLRQLVVEQFGTVDEILHSNRFFREQLAAEIAFTKDLSRHFASVRPAIILQAAFERDDPHCGPRRAANVTLIGCGPWFWDLGNGVRPKRDPAAGEIVLNQVLADQLSVQAGDELILRVPRPGAIPQDHPIGEKEDATVSRRLSVIDVVPARGLGRFDLRPNQRANATAFVATATVQDLLDQPQRVNALLACGHRSDEASGLRASAMLHNALKPRLTDYGLSVSHVHRTSDGLPTSDYFQLTSDQMMIASSVVQAAKESLADWSPQVALTYLANSITVVGSKASIPYSTVTGIDSLPPLGPLTSDAGDQPIGPMGADEIVLNSWAASDLADQGSSLAVGARVELEFFEPETVDGEVRTRRAAFRLKAIAPLAAPGQPLLTTNDPDLTPQLPGVTDQDSIGDWDPPFPFDAARVRSRPPQTQDEDYWDDYRATPKAFVSLATAQRLWSSRFGNATAVRIPPAAGLSTALIAQRLEQAFEPAELGLSFQPVKRQALEAAAGNTSFAGLFLGFSMFLVAAALMLVATLFRLLMERRARQIGLMLALGMPVGRVRRVYNLEGSAVAAAGSTVGLALAVVFAWTMLKALESPYGWQNAIRGQFLRLWIDPKSLLLGWFAGLSVAAGVVAYSVRAMNRRTARELLAGQFDLPGSSPSPRRARRLGLIAAVVMCLAALLGTWATTQSGEAQSLVFFASGACVLVSILTWTRTRLAAQPAADGSPQRARFPLLMLACRSIGRNPARTLLTMGLVASACYLIVAVSTFRLSATEQGRGGFDWIVELDTPTYFNPATRNGREQLGFDADDERLFQEASIVPIRVSGGDDASCLNLYRPHQPRLLGVPKSMSEIGRFDWAATADLGDNASPWSRLERPAAGETDPLPVVIDRNTAIYSLHLRGSVGERFSVVDGRGRQVQLQVAGLLRNSIFQGDLIVSESALLSMFPQISGYRMLLLDAPQSSSGRLVEALQQRLGDLGLNVTSATDRLQSLLEVQNTYLSAFQSLGGLGLLLGTAGLAAVQLRNMLVRRAELGLMAAAGFGRRRLITMIMIESSLLLAGGLAAGLAASLAATLPHLFARSASISWWTLLAMLAAVLVVGSAAGFLAARGALKIPPLDALRRD